MRLVLRREDVVAKVAPLDEVEAVLYSAPLL